MKYRKKPVDIEAIRFVAGTTKKREIIEFCPIAQVGAVGHTYEESMNSTDIRWLVIPTLEGAMHVSEGDYIIRGVEGEFYPCKPHIFDQTYEKIP